MGSAPLPEAALRCGGCGAAGSMGARFCAACGAPLRADRPEPARRLVTTLFCDLVGSTSLAELVDAEAVRHLQLRYFAVCSDAIMRHGGTVEKYIGDAVMAVFGVPEPHEDDAVRACRAALELVRDVERLSEEAATELGIGITVRVGITSGTVVVGQADARQALVTGDPVNVAARLQQAAPPGGILIDGVTRELAEDAITVEPADVRSVRGRAEHVVAFRLLDADGAAERSRDTTMVGRAAELAEVRAVIDRAHVAATAAVVLVTGPAGIGKSHFVDALEGAWRLLRGACRRYGDASPIALVGEWIDAAPGADSDELVRRVARLADDGPLVLVAEDLHYAAPDLIDLLDRIGRLPAPITVVCTARGVASLQSRFLAAAHRVELEALDDHDARAVLADALPDADVDLVAHAVAAADGNPLFLRQLAAHHRAGGDAVPPTLVALLQARVAALAPDELEVAELAAVVGREFWVDAIGALAPDRDPLQTELALAALEARDIIRAGRGATAFRPQSPTLSRVFGAGLPYTFANALLQEVVYEAMARRRRGILHDRFAEVIAADPAPDARAAAIVAFHRARATELREVARPRPAVDDALGELAVGDEVAGYRIEAVAGRGGMGVVYRARDGALGRPVALKVIAPQLGRDPRFRERFVRESRLAARLEHPHVVPVYRAGDDAGLLYLAMRLIDGDDLASVLRAGPIAPARAAAITAQVAGALDAAHVRGLVHRDVKPANILLHGSGLDEHAYLTDFGLSVDRAAVDASLTRSGQWVGTVLYVAPEQVRAEPVDAQADVYALGCVLYQSLTGRPPFEGNSEIEVVTGHLTGRPPRPSEHGAPVAFDRVVARALAKDPATRYRSTGDLGRAALAAAAGTRPHLEERSVATGAAAPAARPRPARSRRRLVAAGVGGVAVAAAAAVAVAVAGGGDGARPATTGTSTSAATPPAPTNAAGRVVATLDAPIVPEMITVEGGQVWLLERGRLGRVDPAGGASATFPPPLDAGGVRFEDFDAGGGALWITNSGVGVDIVDPATARLRRRITLLKATGLAIDGDGAWVVTLPTAKGRRGRLWRVAADADRPVGDGLPVGKEPSDVVVAAGSVWVADRAADEVRRIDPATRRLIATIRVGDAPETLAVSDAGIWVFEKGDETLSRIDPDRNTTVGAPARLGKDLVDLAAAGGAVWASGADRTVTRLDATTGAVIGQPLFTGSSPGELVAGPGEVWVADAVDLTVTRIEVA